MNHEEEQAHIALQAMREMQHASFLLLKRFNGLSVQVWAARALIGIGMGLVLANLWLHQHLLSVISLTASLTAILMLAHAHWQARRLLAQMKVLAEEALERARQTKEILFKDAPPC